MRRRRLKLNFNKIAEHRPVPLPSLFSLSLPTCQVTAMLRMLLPQAANVRWALPAWLGWRPLHSKAAGAREENTVSAEQTDGCRRQSWKGFNLSSSQRPFLAAATTEVAGRGGEGEVRVRRRKVLPAGQYPMLPLKYSGKEKGVLLQPPLLLPETWSQWLSCVRTTSYVVMPLR